MERDYIQRPVDEAYRRGIEGMGAGGSAGVQDWLGQLASMLTSAALMRGGVGNPTDSLRGGLTPSVFDRFAAAYRRFVMHGDPRPGKEPDPNIVRQFENMNQRAAMSLNPLPPTEAARTYQAAAYQAAVPRPRWTDLPLSEESSYLPGEILDALSRYRHRGTPGRGFLAEPSPLLDRLARSRVAPNLKLNTGDNQGMRFPIMSMISEWWGPRPPESQLVRLMLQGRWP